MDFKLPTLLAVLIVVDGVRLVARAEQCDDIGRSISIVEIHHNNNRVVIVHGHFSVIRFRSTAKLILNVDDVCAQPLSSSIKITRRSSCHHQQQQQQQQCSAHCNYTDSTYVCSALILTNVSESIISIVIIGVFHTYGELCACSWLVVLWFSLVLVVIIISFAANHIN